MSDVADQFDRLPPHSTDAEMSLLGSIMLQASVLEVVRAIVGPEDFYSTDNKFIFEAILEIRRRGAALDAIILREELINRGQIHDVGGVTYLGRLLNSVPSAAHAEHYARIVAEKAKLRNCIEIFNDALRASWSNVAATEVIHNSTQRLVAELQRCRASQFQTIGDAAMDAYDAITGDAPALISTGFRDLDETLMGWALGEIWIIGARPSMGKSTLIRQLLAHAAEAGVPSALISLEEPVPKVARNLLSRGCTIQNQRLRSGRTLTEAEVHQLADGVNRLAKLPLYVTDRARRINDISNVAHTMVARHGVKLIAVDHLQRVRTGARSPYEAVTAASGALSDLAKELNIVLLVACQLNRETEHRADPRPSLSDLRDSGAIEQDADGVLFLFRPDYYERHDPTYIATHSAEIIVAKARDGVSGEVVKLETDLRYMRFADWGHHP